jgi:hypothetical protein
MFTYEILVETGERAVKTFAFQQDALTYAAQHYPNKRVKIREVDDCDPKTGFSEKIVNDIRPPQHRTIDDEWSPSCE